MDTLMALQNLAVTVNNLKESIDLTAIRVSSISNSNNTRASQYHSTFSELLSKYSGFAVNYKFELDNLHKSLLNDINLQQKERERQEREFQEKLESLSNKSTHSNLEIVENVEETEYHSSANSINNMSSLAPNSPQQYDHESETNTASMEIPSTFPSNPEPMKSKKSVPISAPKPKPATTPKRKTKSNNNHRNNKQTAPKSKVATKPKSSRKTKKSPASTPKPKASKPMVVRTVTAEIEQKNQNEARAPEEEDKYVYRADKIRFARDFPCKIYDEDKGEYKAIDYRHTTMVYIGNIPSNIKVAAVQFFVMKKFKVTMRQIEETKLQKGRGFTQYALVRFRSDVGLDKITKCMEMVNSENAQIKEDKKKAKDTMHVAMKKSSKTDVSDAGKSKKKLRTSWQTRVFIKFQDPEYHYSYYDTEDDMYNDSRAKHALFIRNFDILNTKCHKELTDLLLTFGDLVKDIDIRLDAFGDPFCIVIFKYLNEAIYCCNSDVYFNGRRLEMRYSKF